MKFSIVAITLVTALTTPGIITPAYAEQAAENLSQLSVMEADGDRDKQLTAFEESMDMSDVIALFREQQKEMAAQRTLLEDQARKIEALTQELETIRAPLPAASKEVADQRALLESQSQKIATLTRELDSMKPALSVPDQQGKTDALANVSSPVSVTEVVPEEPRTAKEAEVAAGNAVAQAQADNPSRDMLKDFTGAWRLPGTNAALAIGGFVKTDIVYNYDPLQIKDRFIVGSIPVGDAETTGDIAQSSITANQSRLNFDLRTPTTDYGIMRAFIEGDFAGNDDTFRLRHAFGQWRKLLAGKTWSTFMDPEASPEEIDFEGLNGRINVRQAQLRFMPTFGEEYELQLALEDPNPEIQNGSGVTRTPDIVVAGRFQPRDRLHLKMALLLREIRGQDTTTGDVAKQWAWGTSLSGRFLTPQLDARDSLLFQLNYGDAIGRYVNDLSSIGNYDGIFNPGTDNLQLFKVVSGYVSWQHWWGANNLRSNFTFGAVEINNPGFVSDDSYKRTLRFSSNLIWSPIPRIDIGGEYLWGRRENKDGESGDATQLQLGVTYRF